MNAIIFVFLCLTVYSGYALECYVCQNQEGNIEKCLNTIKTCEPDEDVCLSEISWGSPPYWSQGATKQFYVSKRCASKRKCESRRQNQMSTCTHLWYVDWKCSECCQGDRCNYYIISGTSKPEQSIAVITSLVFTIFTIVFRM